MPRAPCNQYPRNFGFRMTEADGERLDAVAAAHRTSPGEWARAMLSPALGMAYEERTVKRYIEHARVLGDILAELRRQSDILDETMDRTGDCASAVQAMRDDIQRFTDLVLDRIGVERAP